MISRKILGDDKTFIWTYATVCAPLLNLAKGQQEIMMLLAKQKKKTKKPVTVLNLGRRFKGPAQPIQAVEVSSDEDDDQDEEDITVK